MDNITHSLTGALTAKIIEKENVPAAGQTTYRRTLFWLLVLSANLPDIDAAFGLFGSRLFSIEQHRGITHSFLFAPLFAMVPATLFYIFGKLKNFRVLWLVALLGLIVHIFFDLITPFGTQIFAPLSTKRYAFDWMFIIDPIFTIILALMLLVGKILSKWKGLPILAGVIVLSYLLAELILHSIAYHRVEQAVDGKVKVTNLSALPQPLSLFSWMGLVQTKDGAMQTFFSVLSSDDTLAFAHFENASDEFVVKALQRGEAQWYLRFARHPWIRSIKETDHHVVEFLDLQFSIDQAILRTVGFTERSIPFVLRFSFSPDGRLLETTFDGRPVHK